MIKGPNRLAALAKPCSLLGRDSGFIGSRVEETEARINRKVSEFSKVFVKIRGFYLSSSSNGASL